MALDQTSSSGAPAHLPAGTRVAMLTSSYHAELTGAMAVSARDFLFASGLDASCLVDLSAPGAFELPVLAAALAARDDIDAVLCFGLVLKGQTEHDRHIAGAIAHGLTDVGLSSGKPVLFGVLTCNTLEQAQERARRTDQGGLDKGREVARAAVEALAVLNQIKALPLARKG